MAKPQVIMKEEYQDELDDIYTVALELGKTPQQAQELVFKRLEYLNHCEDYGDPLDNISILKKYPKGMIEGYDSMPENTKKKVLKALGINPKKPIWENVYCYFKGTQRKITVFICGEERMDKEWITKRIDGRRVASDQAVIRAKNDPSLVRELNKISNSAGY